MAAHDRGLLTAQEVELFAMWLKKNGKPFRVGRGEFQIIQVLMSKGWGAICRDAKGVITTPQEIRPLIELYKSGRNLIAPLAPPPKNPSGKSGVRRSLDDLRDEFAMLAAEKIAPSIDDLQGMSGDRVEALLKSWAEVSYAFAGYAMAARESLRVKEQPCQSQSN